MKYAWHRFKFLLRYLIVGKSQYYIHSPFVYQLIRGAFVNHKQYYIFDQIELIRQSLEKRKDQIETIDYGAGSSVKLSSTSSRSLGEITSSASIMPRYGRLLFRLCQYYRPKTILELGTSVGLGTSYLSAGDASCKVITIEGNPKIANVANTIFEQLELTNIEQHVGTFETAIQSKLSNTDTLDLVYIDGSHNYSKTMSLYAMIEPFLAKNCLIIFDDIYWSPEMTMAWKEIQLKSDLHICIDIYKMGLCFRVDNIAKENFTLYY